MARPITLFTIQWGDLSLEEVCKLAKEMGFEGLELSAAHLDMKRAATEPAYVEEVKATLAKYGLGCWSISNHLAGQCVLDTFGWRPALGINFDPSHLLWQGMDPVVFCRDFIERVYHVHAKDVKMNLDGRNGIIGSHITFGNTRRGWNFVSLGHGDVDFDGICRELNQGGYNGPISIEWEDSGMDRVYGATEACEYIMQYNFAPSTFAFDSAIKN